MSKVLNLNVSINKSSSFGSFATCASVSLLKQYRILVSLFLSMSIQLIHSVFTSSPKKLFVPSFSRNVVFPHPLLPTTKIFPQNCPS